MKLLLDLGNSRLKWALSPPFAGWTAQGAIDWDAQLADALVSAWDGFAPPSIVVGASVVVVVADSVVVVVTGSLVVVVAGSVVVVVGGSVVLVVVAGSVVVVVGASAGTEQPSAQNFKLVNHLT